ncbi:MAG: hypothetical protein BV458_04575 [Thermoplasmata archaeon M9B2D]|nr:MAG: hypothetical protein BV458_04575 [Thermoplasmata archaeon M9B2D]
MKISFLGDVVLDKPYKVDIELDNFVFNLEYPLSTSGTPAKNKINLGVDTPYIKETFGKFPIAVNLANNHIMDYGEEAFLKTVDYLTTNSIGFFGAGNTKNNYNNPYIFGFEDKKVALLGYSCPSTHAVFGSDTSNGSALLDVDAIIKDIHSCRADVDMVIVSLHWGDEEIKYPKPTDVKKAHMLIDAGADMIYGHHAHVMQGVEVYKGKYIFYGVGNFIFPDIEVPANYDGEKFQKRIIKVPQKNNKQALMIGLDESLSVSCDTAFFQDGTVSKKSVKIPKWIPRNQKQYDLAVMYERRLGTMQRFLQHPRLPTFKQIKIFVGLKG